ncbi:hypothetical protein ACE939_06550 [Aquimarina sp. W85]|uniref:hypothetical protein n=1 Tax=Aquimarina rhodophyticola TaxID=3342246 RepID=UPI00366CBBDD
MKLTTYTTRALVGGVFATLVTGLGSILLGNLSGYEAKSLIESSLPGINTLFNTVILASATILALMLTLLSVSVGSNSTLKKAHYSYVLRIAKLDTAVFISSMISFLLLNLPITESDNVPSNWFNIIYYISLALASIHCGAIISVVLMLYNTISNIINIIGFGNREHPLVRSEEDNEEQ